MHAFTPADLERHAGNAGFGNVVVRGEELAASIFGWANRSLEATAVPDDVPWAWRVYAYRGYLALQALDRALLEGRLPAAIFYNLLVSARRRSRAAERRGRRRLPAGRAQSAALLELAGGAGGGRPEAGGLARHPAEHRVEGQRSLNAPLAPLAQRGARASQSPLGADPLERV